MRAPEMDASLLIAAIIICACFGSIHAYGVLLTPLEGWLGIGRGSASLGYSTALLALTFGVFVNGRLSEKIPRSYRLLPCGLLAAVGLALAALLAGLPSLILGFGLAYGLANGVAYSLSLDIAARAMPGREATAMGIATAAYGLGAVAFAQLFSILLSALTIQHILLAWAAMLLAVCLMGGMLARHLPPETAVVWPPHTTEPWSGILGLWATYLLGAFGGLMVLAHAPGVAAHHNGTMANAGLAAGVVSAGSVVGGYLGGILAGKISQRWSIALPMLTQTAAIAALMAIASSASAIIALGFIGLSYGVLIAAVPAAVRNIWGSVRFAEVYGRVFTAWGLAGLIGPFIAGVLYDASGSYDAALATASVLSLASAGLSSRLAA